MKLIHGSPINLAKNGGFKVVNYEFDKTEPECTAPVGNNNHGPGIYTFVAEGEFKNRAFKDVGSYAGGKGYVHFCSVEIEQEDLMNNMDIDVISKDEWHEVIEKYITRRRTRFGHDPEMLREITEDFIDDIESGNFDKQAFYEKVDEIKDSDPDGLLEIDPFDYEDGYEWQDAVLEDYALSDPCIHIYDNQGGPDMIIEGAFRASDNLWQVLSNIIEDTAYLGTGAKGFNDYGYFKDAFFEVMDGKGEFVGALVENDKFFVCFDTNKLSLDKVVQMKPQENEMTL